MKAAVCNLWLAASNLSLGSVKCGCGLKLVASLCAKRNSWLTSLVKSCPAYRNWQPAPALALCIKASAARRSGAAALRNCAASTISAISQRIWHRWRLEE